MNDIEWYWTISNDFEWFLMILNDLNDFFVFKMNKNKSKSATFEVPVVYHYLKDTRTNSI